ncbi:MAG: MASE1 domain-containing protein [Anaerolineaceae bacterium]
MKTKLRLYGIYLVKIILLAIIYRIAAILGLSMAYVQANTSPVWPPTGIALAALMLFGIKLWPGVALGVLLGSLFTGAPIPLAIGMTFGNTLEAVIGAYLLHRFLDFHNTLDRIKDVIGLSLVSVIATMVSATFGAITLSIIDSALWQYFISIWSTWWIGDLLGALVVTPLLLTWLTRPWNKTSITRYVEGLLVFALLGVLTWFVFSNNPPTGILHLALLYVIFPLMIWISLRFGTRGAAIGLFLVSGIAIWGTIRELGPFSHQPLNDSLVLLQTFTGVVSLTSLILAAATAERLKAIFALHQKVNDLAVLNDASETFLGTFDQESIYKTICQLAVKRFGLEVAWIEIADLSEEQNRVIAIQGLKVGDVPKLKKVWQGNPAGFVSDKIEVRTVRSLENDPDEKDMQYQAFGLFPLTFGTQSMGTLKLLSNQEDYFTNDRTVLIQSFANLAAVTIQNSWLLERVRKGNEQLHALSQRLMKAQEEERLH